MSWIKTTLIALLAISLSACATPNIGTIEKTPLNISDSDPVILGDVVWMTITKENVMAVLDKNGGVLFAVTPDTYKIIALNSVKIAEYIKQQKAVTEAYRKYYESRE